MADGGLSIDLSAAPNEAPSVEKNIEDDVEDQDPSFQAGRWGSGGAEDAVVADSPSFQAGSWGGDATDTDLADIVFMEFFAGEGVLTAAVAAEGVPCVDPQDVASGGADFGDVDQVDRVKKYLHQLTVEGKRLILHFAPPCSTFSRARDRSWKTRLRSTTRPQGLTGMGWKCKVANLVARHTLELVEWAVVHLHAFVTMENPESSYMWNFLTFDESLDYSDVVFSPCLFGADFAKPTRLRCWGWCPRSLAARCSLKGGVFTCGRTRERPHRVLQFGGGSTAEAAAYVPGVCAAWAREIKDLAMEAHTAAKAAKKVRLSDEGRVLRHEWRGTDAQSKKEIRDQEDQASTAGMRNPAAIEAVWPALWDGVSDLRKLLLTLVDNVETFQSLADCCGADPKRPPPSEAEVSRARRCVEILYNVAPGRFDEHHSASPWRFALVAEIQKATGDRDEALPRWLEHGAPMGLSQKIDPGGHFPTVSEVAALSVNELDDMSPCMKNHPSYEALRDDARPPAVKLLEDQVEAGFAYLFADIEEAKATLGSPVHPAPLGNVAKLKEDGTFKDRLIQDQSANSVNAAVVLPERQVLPRGIDHGRDLAVLAHELGEDEQIETLVLDFKDAFMSLPIHRLERRFNCAHTTVPIRRGRQELFEGEVLEGCFVVWKVLGFGGRPNPLIFSRAASFASRVAQALINPEDPARKVPGLATGRLQLYVDDPVLTVRGNALERRRALDLVMLFWLILGVPLSWKKGKLFKMDEAHTWIGIVYSITDQGSIMRLPKAFIEELSEMIEPLCSLNGFVHFNTLEVVIGKAARVAHVVPAAKPFVAGLWGALSASRKAACGPRREAPLHHAPSRRFCYSAAWLRALLADDGSCPLVLERLVSPWAPRAASTSSWRAEFDASVYGGGGVLRHPEGYIAEYFTVVWSDLDAPHLNVMPGDCRHQTFFEALTLLLVLLIWGDHFTSESLAVLGDNVGALTTALSMAGRGSLLAVTRELSWRKARRRWCYEVGHLPSEFNVVADALSRIADPSGVPWPSEALSSATMKHCPKVADIWRAGPQ